ncbi:MAG: hypothetical protein Q8936_23850 [Bacillota bacterium]|nr:hypothetical protein [Bacillota bacterium]
MDTFVVRGVKEFISGMKKEMENLSEKTKKELTDLGKSLNDSERNSTT